VVGEFISGNRVRRKRATLGDGGARYDRCARARTFAQNCSQEPQPRTFVIRFHASSGDDLYRNLHGLLRVALRRFRLRAVSVEEHK
jgi:hypothetical protein